LYVSSDIGAIEPGRWQFWQARCRIGAMSFENVTSFGAVSAARAANWMRHTTDPTTSVEFLIIATSLRTSQNPHLFYIHNAGNAIQRAGESSSDRVGLLQAVQTGEAQQRCPLKLSLAHENL
jgi:hypothetical protein